MAEKIAKPVWLWAGLCALAAGLFTRGLIARWPHVPTGSGAALDLDRVILLFGTLPRAAVAILAGATLGLSGLLLQRVLRNPMAEPSTLGISAGAQLAMAVATLYLPRSMEISQNTVALAGGLAAVGLILALTWKRGLEPVSVVLAGMMVALTANAASAALILANGDYLFSLFIWGGGSLVQESWDPALALLGRLVVGSGVSLLLLRPLAILGLDEGSARGLGVALHSTRFLVIGLAVWMATSVVAEVGVIGFVGLAAPALATLSGARSLRQKIIAAPIIGAVLLWLTDGCVQLAAGSGGERIPTGAATALLGGPLLLWLLPRLRMAEWPSLARGADRFRRAPQPCIVITAISFATSLAVTVALLLGRGQLGWSIASGNVLADLIDWRIPRVGITATAGAMLAAAGVAIQRVTTNPLASPEVLGIGSGAGAGLAAVLMVNAFAGLGWQLAGSTLGSVIALAAILTIASRGNFGPERLLLAGIAMSALCSAVITAVIALGNMQSYQLLRWLSGSTNEATGPSALVALVSMVVLSLPLFVVARWLDILPLGASVASALGIPVKLARLALVALAALLSAFAAMFVGPMSFIGLVAPHLARLLGLGRARDHLAGAILIGAGLMVVSDWLSRMVVFPYQLPAGLFASLLGGPYLIYLLGKGVRRHG